MTVTAIDNIKKLTKKEIEAARAEKHALANAQIKRLRNQYNELAAIKSAADKQQETIKARIAEILDEQEMMDFIDVDGTPIIGYRKTEKNELDKEKLIDRFGEKAVQDCYTLRIGRSFFSKR
jgi:RNA-binding protein YhbY